MTAAVVGAVRGRPTNSALSDSLARARQVNGALREELRAQLRESEAFATEVRAHAMRVHYATVAERPDLALGEAGCIVALADRRITQAGGRGVA